MLKFTKIAPYIPDPARSTPLITEEDKARAAEKPPHVVPFHCKPWVDGQKIGWTLFYGYVTPITIVGEGGGKIRVENFKQLLRETNQPRTIDPFADGHFGISTGLTLATPSGYVSLLLPPTHPPSRLRPLTGVVETDWYPRQIFIPCISPKKGESIHLDHKMEIARVVVVPRHETLEAAPMTAAEEADINKRRDAYLAEEANHPSRWTAASGDIFTHLYKIKSKEFRG